MTSRILAWLGFGATCVLATLYGAIIGLLFAFCFLLWWTYFFRNDELKQLPERLIIPSLGLLVLAGLLWFVTASEGEKAQRKVLAAKEFCDGTDSQFCDRLRDAMALK